jgi:pimeloyl-ACP methyl ester carboxylesterase
VVLCSGFASEAEVFRSHLANFARVLAEAGYPAIRFDYAGYGDSEGDFRIASPAGMEDDIGLAADALREKTRVDSIILVGLRLGGTLALRTAARRPDVAGVALWEPLPRPWETIFAQLRATVSRQMVLFKSVSATREQIVENVLADRPTIVGGYDFNVVDDGYPLVRDVVLQAQAMDLARDLNPLNFPVLVLHVRRRLGRMPQALSELCDALARAGSRCTSQTITMPQLPWVHGALYSTASSALYDATLEWMED